jgi:hypothetical protein
VLAGELDFSGEKSPFGYEKQQESRRTKRTFSRRENRERMSRNV